MPNNQNTPWIKHPSVQKFKRNIVQSQNRENLPANQRQEQSKNEPTYGKIISIFFVFRISDNRRRDLDGMVSTVLDSLVHAQIIKDDDLGTIPSASATWIPCAKGEEGVDIVMVNE